MKSARGTRSDGVGPVWWRLPMRTRQTDCLPSSAPLPLADVDRFRRNSMASMMPAGPASQRERHWPSLDVPRLAAPAGLSQRTFYRKFVAAW
jgi:hypothetical protein